MRKIISAFLILLILVSVTLPLSVNACDENQSNAYVMQIIFGNNYQTYETNDNCKLLFDSLYLCSEQCDNQGQDKLTFVKKHKIGKFVNISKINIDNDALHNCAHKSWDYVDKSNNKAQQKRKKLLQSSVEKVFDFKSAKDAVVGQHGKVESFSQLLYYSHILADYLANDPNLSSVNINGKQISSYCGEPYIEVNGGIPSFSNSEKNITDSFIRVSALDSLGRCGVAYANVGPDTLSNAEANIGHIIPSGWSNNNKKYSGIVDDTIYNRCHLLARSLTGCNENRNIITGTRYMNARGMEPKEQEILRYVQRTNNHVLYRVTPIFKGENLVASGVQMEAYSVEDKGEAICFNIYCYNIQPGININYFTGETELIDSTFGVTDMIPFAVPNANSSNPDLIYEMNKVLEDLFANGNSGSAGLYNILKGKTDSLAYKARAIGYSDGGTATNYVKLKECEYEYFSILRDYVPALLRSESYFAAVFK